MRLGTALLAPESDRRDSTSYPDNLRGFTLMSAKASDLSLSESQSRVLWQVRPYKRCGTESNNTNCGSV